MKEFPNTEAGPHRQWSDSEIAILDSYANRPASKKALIALFPGRSLNATRLKLYERRRILGVPKNEALSQHSRDIETPMLDPGDPGVFAPTWQDRMRPVCELANMRFLEALRAAA